MRTTTSAVVGLGFSLILLAAAPAAHAQQDMTGTWALAVELDVGSCNATLVLTQEGNEISGTYTGTLGEELPVTGEATEDGIQISFDSAAGAITYTGKLQEGVFEGTCEYGQLGSGTFKGEKQSDR